MDFCRCAKRFYIAFVNTLVGVLVWTILCNSAESGTRWPLTESFILLLKSLGEEEEGSMGFFSAQQRSMLESGVDGLGV